MEKSVIVFHSLKLSTAENEESLVSFAKKQLNKFGISVKDTKTYLYKKSVDARKKDDVHFVCSVAVCGVFSAAEIERAKSNGLSVYDDAELVPIIGTVTMEKPPLIVGSGPCGLFCALLLAEQGYKPIILERGGDISERTTAVQTFYQTRELDIDCNVQFGAGGAGTFSDGKLVTRIGDSITKYVLKRFVEFGADENILYMAKPHIGTDVLSKIVTNMIARIEALGGEVRFHTKFLGYFEKDGNVYEVATSRGTMSVGALILALGHSARDTYEYLFSKNLAIEAKPFSVGMRIEHRAEDIDHAMYGANADLSVLGHAEYTLSANTDTRGVYTFCMCPGGEVVGAASEQGGVVVNGMSNHKRDGINDNCAVVCSIFKEDYGGEPQKAIAFQRQIEKAAFSAGGEDYAAPLTTVGDFLERQSGTKPSRIKPTYMNGDAYRLSTPEAYLPQFVCEAIRGGLSNFDKKIKGFAAKDAILCGAETRTSAPLRILRNPETYCAIGTDNLYPAGEGAGYAGGITSAATDGIHVALALMKRFAPHG